MNYQKAIITLAVMLFMSISTKADGVATYLPLTTSTNDGSWIFFGVNGFSDGLASSRSAVAVGFSTDFVEVEDNDTQDSVGTWGLSASGAAQPATDNLLAVQGIDDSNLTTLKVAAEVIQPFVALEAVRSMYIRVDSVTPNVKIDYKSSMEGQTLEIFKGATSPLYSVTISQDYTYNNSAEAVISVRVAASVVKLSNIVDVIDYQFGENPLEPKYYSKAEHQDNSVSLSAPAKTATFYHFDAISQQWKIWDTHFSGVANDFTAFSKGDAYWGRIDIDDNPINNDGTIGSGITDSDGNDILGSGLVLGKSGDAIPNVDAYKYDDNTSKLTDGWNMLAFDDNRPYIRHASTGLVVTSDTAVAGKIILTDFTAVNSIEIVLSANAVNVQATEINTAVEAEKLKGTLPKSFNIRAFASDTIANPNRIIFISDAKFTIEDEESANNITAVNTLTGDNPYNELSFNTTAINDLNSSVSGQKTATSVYGEYSLIVDIMTSDLVGESTAATLDSAGAGSGSNYSAKLAFGTSDKDYTPIPLNITDDQNPTAITTKASIESHALFNLQVSPSLSYGKAIELDSLNDGTEDKMIISSTTPFYIKDATYTRIFEYAEATGDGVRIFKVVGSHNAIIKPTAAQAIADVADSINDVADKDSEDTGVYAGVDDTKIVAVSTTLSTFDVKDLEDGNYAFLEETNSDANITKGAVAGVYALDTVTKMSLVQHSFSFDNVDEPDNAADSIAISVGAGTATATLASAAFVADTTDTAERLSYFDRIVATINADILTDKVHAFAFHDYTTADNNFTATKITIDGMNASSVAYTMVNGGGAVEAAPNAAVDKNALVVGTLGSSWTSITPDLKSNVIYAPNYTTYGPLYTIREAGYSIKAMLKATTDVIDTSIGWDAIDLTRDKEEWFKNNEFNLFSVDLNSAYWVYLASDSNSSIVIGTPSYQATYTYYFDNNDSNGEYVTKNIINAGQFSVDITGLDGEVAIAYVSINGEEVPLKRNGFADEYTANFTKYALKSLNEGATGPISMTIRATDGKGEATTEYDAYTLDYTAPVLNAPTAPDADTISFTDDNTTTTYHVFKEYIPELRSSRMSADLEVNRLIGSYSEANASSIRLCKDLTFGHVNNIRVVGADGNGTNAGVIGFSNLSNAQQFTYATMLKDVHIIKDDGGDNNQTTKGEIYDTSCLFDTNATNDNGVSLKVVDDANLTARIIYEVIDGVTLSTSVPWVSAYSIGGVAVIQVQNMVEYKSKPFFLQYNSKIYRGAFPATTDAASGSLDSNATAIELDSAVEFTLDGNGDSSGGSGNEIFILNDALLMP